MTVLATQSPPQRHETSAFKRPILGTLDAYWEANLDLTHVVPELDLYDDRWPILSLQRQLPPAKFVFDDEGRRGTAVDALVASGCIVSGGTVRRSVLFSKVRVGEGSLVEDSDVLPRATIGRGSVVPRAVIDKRCIQCRARAIAQSQGTQPPHPPARQCGAHRA